jgi:hypothetical protein
VTDPVDNRRYQPGELTNGAFRVCGTTTSTDAVDLPATLGSAASNYCVGVGTATPTCVRMTAATGGGMGCVDVMCAGGTPFDLTVTLTDSAGNPTQRRILQVACVSALPAVQIISPAGATAPFSDVTRRLLAASSSQTLRDLDATAAGAQHTVVACTDQTSGMAQLFAGQQGSTLAALGASVAVAAAQPSDNCPTGYGGVARFTNATLPESAEGPTGTLTTATELRVNVTSTGGQVGMSPTVALWVDSIAPTLAPSMPAGLCTLVQASTTDFSTNVQLASSSSTATLTVTNGGTTDTYNMPTFSNGIADFGTVLFRLGTNQVAGTTTEPSGNTGSLTAPCTVQVGTPPTVTFTNPAVGSRLCATGSTAAGCIADADPVAAAWQGQVTVRVTVGGVPATSGSVTFTASPGGSLGTASIDANGDAQLPAVTIMNGTILLTATTSNIGGNGIGMATLTLIVDTTVPNGIIGLVPTVVDRRETRFHLAWTAPDDGGMAVSGYDIRYSGSPIDATNFDTLPTVPYTGSPSAPGTPDGIDIPKLNIEKDYYFALAATDAVGARSPIFATTTAVAARFLTSVPSGTGLDGSGHTVDGVGDLGRPAGLAFTPDGLSDLVMGSVGGSNAYVFFGTATGYSTTPSITITVPMAVPPPAGTRFLTAAYIGDIDADGLEDFAVSSNTDSRVYIYSRKNPPASWGSTTSWPATLTDAQANYVITMPAGIMSTRPLARLGNFDGMGSDDLGIGISLRSTNTGGVIIVRGGATFASLTPDATNSIEISGMTTGTVFGSGVIGIGQFYPTPAGPTIVVTAPNAGSAFAFPGQSPASAMLTVADALDSTVGVAADRYGASFGFLGPLGPSPGGVTFSGATTGAYVDVHLGTVATGPFLGTMGGAPAATVRLINTATTTSFGVVNIGGGIKGTSRVVSIIGESLTETPVSDLVVAGQGEAGNSIYIVNGAAIPAMSGTIDVAAAQTAPVPSIVKISNQIPAGWTGYTLGTIVPDVNGDGYGDFAVGEFAPGRPGRAVLFY